ncbi:MAG: outer membrane lipoprotein-sorting protein [Spirochaetaceae bacterium]|jgi:outer membrane lipoprotein-sorting protein|nr:outer membrane lipoprotein-sorting protein [Spirochaetaceae bacterium]
MKKTIFIFCLQAACLWAVFADDAELLKTADSLASYMDADFSALYTIVQDKPGQGRSATEALVYRRDSSETYVIIIQKPPVSRGQGYLKQGNTLWFYDPESKKFNSTSSKERFQNSNARNSDFTRSTLSTDYKVLKGENGKLGRFNCRILTLEAVTNEVAYPKMKIWISDDSLVRKTEDYSLSGQLLRSSAIPDYYILEGRYIPKAILLTDEMRGAKINGKFVKEKTQITITTPSFKKLSNGFFSKAYLEQVNK